MMEALGSTLGLAEVPSLGAPKMDTALVAARLDVALGLVGVLAASPFFFPSSDDIDPFF